MHKVVIRIETTSEATYNKLKEFLAQIENSKTTVSIIENADEVSVAKKGNVKATKGRKLLERSFSHFPVGDTHDFENLLIECKNEKNPRVVIQKIMNELCRGVEITGMNVPKNWKEDLQNVLFDFCLKTVHDETPSFVKSSESLGYSSNHTGSLMSALQYVLDSYSARVSSGFGGTLRFEDFIWSLRRFVGR